MRKNQPTFNDDHIPVTGLIGRRILFATFPADGHFNPLTGLAAYLREIGCDVRWYTSKKYAPKLAKLQIPHYGLRKAQDIAELEKNFPERDLIKSQIAKLKFDILHAFILRGPEYFEDIQEIYQEFPFEVMVADSAFTGIPYVEGKMNIPVISIGVMPLSSTSKDLAPPGLGMTPSYSVLGKLKQAALRFFAERFIFRQSNQVMKDKLAEHGIDSLNTNVFDLIVRKATIHLQSGTPGFEYYRSDLAKNVRFIGSLLPYETRNHRERWFDERLNRYEKIIVVTQGTVEKDVNKIIVPTLEAFEDTDVLVVATTGGNRTEEVKARFKAPNLIIEDYIPFADIMPYADMYVSNGGYGGVMLAIEHELPMVVAGVHEGKNEINARIGYFKLGINLKTELPTAAAIRKAAEEIFRNQEYKNNVVELEKEFRTYNPAHLCAKHVKEVLQQSVRWYKPVANLD